MSSTDPPQSKAELIEARRAALPLPDDPPAASDWNSADARTVNVGSGGVQSDISTGGGSDSLRGPATAESSARVDGEALGVNAGEPRGGVSADAKAS